MKIKTKFGINQRVWLMYENQVCNFKIIKLYVEVFMYKEEPQLNVYYDLLDDRHFHRNYEKYKYKGDILFATKEELLNSL